MQITTRLTEAPSDRVVWASTFDRETSDFGNLMNDLTASIAEHVEVALQPEEAARLSAPRTVPAQATEAYLKGRQMQFLWTEDAIGRAMEYYRQAIEFAPDLVEAHAGLAECYLFLGTPGLEAIPPTEAYPKAKAELRKALELDPASAEAYAVLGQISAEYDWDWAKAESEYKRAIELNPDFAMARVWCAQLLSSAGRHDEALDQMRRAQRLEPLDWFVDGNIVVRLYQSGDFQGAIAAGVEALERHPHEPVLLWFLGESQFLAGDFTDAVATLEEAVRLAEGNAFIRTSLGRAYVRAGVRDQAMAILKGLEALDYVPAFPVATLYAELGDIDMAFTWLEKAYEERSGGLVTLKLPPFPDVLRDDPRYNDLVRRVGIPD